MNETIFKTKNYRISFLSSRLFRIETSHYTDNMTQVVINRNVQENVSIVVKKRKNISIYETSSIQVYVDALGNVLKIKLKENNKMVHDFKSGNLKGTARTLDGVNEGCPLGDGVISKDGVAILDDSLSLIVNNGKLHPRKKCKDLYFFAFNNDYRAALNAFYGLTGNVPLIPRYALGNWWSRYHAYSDEEYQALMLKFEKKEIPISVAVIDMDWHYVDNYKEFKDDSLFTKEELNDSTLMENYYSGWTGYTWNKHLFKDYTAFLNFLHKHNLKVTLNLHPGLGVRKYEEAFEKMAQTLNLDAQTTKIIPFDVSSELYMRAYLDVLHHPYEEKGVDFWWIDWQQGKNSKMKNLDPLWALNYYHYEDNNRGNKRPLILSRFGGPGSHRYPLGFSGDTYITWEALRFQPYFTSCASNIGYVWWSHDIGGHMAGSKDNELYLRWLQLGVFSPINRLHSTSNEFTGKEPWKFPPFVENIATFYLRFRKKLIPYLYSMNYLTYKNGKPLVEPMYYTYKDKQAYKMKNQFLFGTELMVCPITSPTHSTTSLANVKAWFPQGKWIDIFTQRIYEGDQTLPIYRGIEYIPVFAHEGSILPLYADDRSNNLSNEQDLEIWVYHGNNEFLFYEDDGESKEYEKGQYSIRTMKVSQKENHVTFVIHANENQKCNLSYQRKLKICFNDIQKATLVCNQNYKIIDKDFVCLEVQDSNQDIVIELQDCQYLKNQEEKEALIDLISLYQMNNDQKTEMFSSFLNQTPSHRKITKDLLGPIQEIFALKK